MIRCFLVVATGLSLLGACTPAERTNPWGFEAEMPLNGTLKYRS